VPLVEGLVLMEGNTVEELRSQRRKSEKQWQDMTDQELVVEEKVEKIDIASRIYLGQVDLHIEGRIWQNYRNHGTRLNDRETADEGGRTTVEEQAD
jgi:hypothetical protein